MHELSVCQSLLSQAEAVARAHGAQAIAEVVVGVGPLSGVEPELLKQAFTVARAGTLAAKAGIVVRVPAVRVDCIECGAQTEVQPQRLLCGSCGGWRTRVVAGDELILERLELVQEEQAHV